MHTTMHLPTHLPTHLPAPVPPPSNAPGPSAGPPDGLPAGLRTLLAAEAAAEEVPGVVEAADLEQAVWLRLLELRRPPAHTGRWIRAAVRAEVRAALRGTRDRAPYAAFGLDPGGGPAARGARDVADLVVDAEQRRHLRAAIARLPGRCPQLVTALMSRSDPTYREISRELGISQGSLGPLRSRCLSCLRTILVSRIGSPVPWGNAR